MSNPEGAAATAARTKLKIAPSLFLSKERESMSTARDRNRRVEVRKIKRDGGEGGVWMSYAFMKIFQRVECFDLWSRV